MAPNFSHRWGVGKCSAEEVSKGRISGVGPVLSDPLLAGGYVPPSAFGFDDYCRRRHPLGEGTIEEQTERCVASYCRRILGRKRRHLVVSTLTQSDHSACLMALAESYDRLNLEFDEPRLVDLPEDWSVYRLYALPSLWPVSQMIRIVKRPSGAFLTVKRTARPEVPGAVQVSSKRHRWLTDAEWTTLNDLLQAAHFFALPSRPDDPNRTVFDGTSFYLEGADRNRHQLVITHSPQGSALATLVEQLLCLGEPSHPAIR